MNSAPRVVPVNLANFHYDVLVQPGLMSLLGKDLRKLSQSTRVAVLTDSTVAPLYLRSLQDTLAKDGFETVCAVIPPGEDHKTLSDLLPVFDAFLGARFERSTPVIGLGGGIITDMAGFVAATMLRGVPLIQVPTTLLAMVDASVGGKTGVNHDVGKNLIGAFHQPSAVLIDPAVLSTLPRRELAGGLAECIKHEIIRDTDGFSNLEMNLARALELDLNYLAELIAHNVTIKARVVEADPFEHGERAHLNFGHTFGHAIESVSDYAYSHGESVALGMVAATELAVDLKLLDREAGNRIIALIRSAGLPTTGLTINPQAVHEAMAFDKKVKASRLRLVLPDRIGHVIIRDDVPPALIRQAIERLRG